MSTFDERRDAFENKYAHDEALRFKVDARANKLLGQWAAERLGLTGSGASDYVKTVINSDFEEAGREDVYRKIASDLGDSAEEAEIRRQMDKTLDEARSQILEES